MARTPSKRSGERFVKALQKKRADERKAAKAPAAPTPSRGDRYSVQFVIIREIEVEATDDLQAEREAFQRLKPADAESALALKVFELLDPEPGALSEDLMESWKYAREHFHTIDRDWVS